MSDRNVDGDRPGPIDRRAAAGMAGERGEPRAPEGEAAAEALPRTDDLPPADDLREQLAAARADAERLEANWKRAAADLANYRRRVEQERSGQARLASAALVINLLPVHDDFGRAVKTLEGALADESWVRGVLAIQRKLAALLESMGVEAVPAEGEPFDPTRHEAVGRAPGPENVCLQVVQQGYTLNGAVIRPAQVVVGDGAEATGSENEGA